LRYLRYGYDGDPGADARHIEARRRDVAQLLLVATSDEAPEIRAQALEALAVVVRGQPAPFVRPFLEVVKAAVHDPVPSVRRAALGAFDKAEHECPELAPVLLAALDDEELRDAATWVLRLVGPLSEAMTAKLRHLLATETGTDLLSVVEAVGNLGHRGRPFVPGLLAVFRGAGSSPDPGNYRDCKPRYMRDSVATALGQIGRGAAPALHDMEVAFAMDGHAGGAFAFAMVRLGSARPDDALAHLVKVALGGDTDLLRAQQWIGMLKEAGRPAVKPLLAAVASGSPQVRLQALRTLEYMGAHAREAVQALRALIDAAADPEDSLVHQARWTLEAIEAGPR
jgi:HEAT repeat protein